MGLPSGPSTQTPTLGMGVQVRDGVGFGKGLGTASSKGPMTSLDLTFCTRERKVLE